jgi:hypothetical protein
MKFHHRLILYSIVLVAAVAFLVSIAPPQPTPELRAACFQTDAAIAKLEIDAHQLAATGQPAEAFALYRLIDKARAQQVKDGCQ